MEPFTKQIEVLSGYRMYSCSETLNSESAFATVCSNKECCYNSAVRHKDDSVTLTQTSAICPYCNHIHTFKVSKKKIHRQISAMKQWLNPQLSFFEKNEERTLSFFPINLQAYVCPQCHQQSYKSNKSTTILVIGQENMISVRCELKDSASILKLSYLPHKVISVEFPLYEQIEFNTMNDHTRIQIITGQDQVLYTVDISDNPDILAKCVVSELFDKYEDVRQTIMDAFQMALKTDIPFEPNEVTLEDFGFLVQLSHNNKHI